MKKTGVLLGLLVISFALSTGVMVNNRQIAEKNRQYEIYLQNQYQRILYDLATNVDNVEVSLSKALVANSVKQRGVLLGDAWNDSKSAQYKLNALPINHSAMMNTSKFLSQVADYSYMVLKKNSAGIRPSKSETVTLQKLKEYSGYVRVRLREFVDDVGANGIDLSELGSNESKEVGVEGVNLSDSITRMSDQIQEYPTLLYDGPFSENVLNIKPNIMKEKTVSIDAAVKLATATAGKDKVVDIDLQRNDKNQRIPVYSFAILRKGEDAPAMSMDISKNGGRIVYILDNRRIGKEAIDAKKAMKKGEEFLNKNGYSNMIATYTLKYDGVLVVNYVKKDKDILLYPDQIKLKIALDDGGVVGMESRQYLIAHRSRNLSKPKVDIRNAAKKIASGFQILNSRTVLIPMESLREVLCHEFYGEYDGERYFIYINATNGTEERILKVVNTDNGELTM